MFHYDNYKKIYFKIKSNFFKYPFFFSYNKLIILIYMRMFKEELDFRTITIQ